MSKLNELIHKLCPDGVQFFELGEIAHYATERIDATNVDENTYVGVENLLQNKQGKTFAISIPISGTVIAFHPGNILIGNIRPYLRKIWLSDCDGGTNGDVLAIQINDEASIAPKYLYHVLSSEQFFHYDIQNSKGAKMPRGNKDAVLRYPIPLPPLPVQHEIANILDNFTSLTAELTVALTAELTSRKKQFEYYRNSIFPVAECDFLQIKDIAVTNIGLATSVAKHKADAGILLLHNSDIQQNRIVLKQHEYITEEFAKKNAKKILQKDDIITVHTGDVGTSAVIDGVYIGAIGFTTITTRIIDKSKVLPQYLCHYLNSQKCKADIASMTISDRSNLNQSNFEKLSIPIPDLDEQKRIISFLDNLDDICSSLSSSLPKEIEARQKQYEYYRDKLLTFKQLP